MNTLIIVDDPADWPLEANGPTVVPARAYLTEPAYGEDRSAKVYNLCQSYRYQSLGYYVSLLAEARGHKPLPRPGTIEDLQSHNLVRVLTDELAELIQQTLAPLKSRTFELSVYFGRSLARRYSVLAKQLFSLLQAPLLRDCIMEVNDNPNVDAGNEDDVLRDALYREVMGVFLRRLEQRHGA